MTNDQPIIFTISSNTNAGAHWIRTKDSRSEENPNLIHYGDLFIQMRALSEKYNSKGYAVLFEID